MSRVIWQKPCDIIVLRSESNAYRIFHRASKKSFELSHAQIQAWCDGNLAGLGNTADEMQADGIIKEIPEPSFLPHWLDDLRPSISTRWVRFYRETPELTILYNTQQMAEINPLLVLGPYGSVIWNCIIDGANIGKIRACVLHLFGADEVLPFLARLMHLGFLVPLEQVLNISPAEQKIIKEFNAPEIQFMISHSRIPWYCIWEVTTICNIRCQICYLQEYQNPGPQGAELDELIEQLDKSGIFYVTLLGGEALLRNDLEEIVTRLRNVNIFVKLITNGHTLTPERAAALAKAGLNHIEISFDGLTKFSHEKSRIPDAFNKAEQSLRIAQENCIPRVGMVLTLHSQSIDDLPSLPVFMQEHGINECYLSLFRKTGLMGSQSAISPVSMEKLSASNRMVTSWRDHYPDLTIALIPICTCGRTSVVIGADMTLRPCPFSYESAVGNLKYDSFDSLWTRMGESARAGTLWCR
jgi:MoaA/NifB/PqqE/SkfB family radical SAM enzyme